MLAAGEAGELWVRGPQVSGEYLGRAAPSTPTAGSRPVTARGSTRMATSSSKAEPTTPSSVAARTSRQPRSRTSSSSTPTSTRSRWSAYPDDEWGECIVAVVVLRAPMMESHRDVDPEELRAFARKSLRGSRTPDRIVFRDELPVTATGKLLRRVLVDELSG